jgi:hypothetical protein
MNVNFFIVLLFFLFSCETGASEGKTVQANTTSHDSVWVKSAIDRHGDILGKCLFSLLYIKNPDSVIDINKYDSIMAKLTRPNHFFEFATDVCYSNYSSFDTCKQVIEKWCYCLRLYESVFVFDVVKNPNYTFEDIVVRIEELKNVLNKYLQEGQTINALSTTQSQMLFLDCVNYATTLNPQQTSCFFSKYYSVAAKMQNPK